MDPMEALALAGVAVGGLAQSVTGLGFALVAAPGLIALLGPSEGVAVVVLLGTLASIIPLLGQWRDARVRDRPATPEASPGDRTPDLPCPRGNHADPRREDLAESALGEFIHESLDAAVLGEQGVDCGAERMGGGIAG